MLIRTLEYGGPTVVVVPLPWRYWGAIGIASASPILPFYFWANAAIDELYASGYRYGMHLPPVVQQLEWECLHRPALLAAAPLLLIGACVVVQVLCGRWPSQWLVGLVAPGVALLALFLLMVKLSEEAFP